CFSSEHQKLPCRQRGSVSPQPADFILRGSPRSSGKKPGFLPVGSRERNCAVAATWQGNSIRRCSATRTEPADLCATPVYGRPHLLRIARKFAIRSRESLSLGRRHGCLRSCLAAGLS